MVTSNSDPALAYDNCAGTPDVLPERA